MFSERARAVIPLVIAASFVAVVTAVQGVWTERWSDRDIAGELKVSAMILEEAFPAEIGPWKYHGEVESSQEQLERAGAVGHISRLYQNKDTGAKIAAFVICATPHDASGHTPDRCYPAAGFEIAETEHRETITLEDGRRAEAFVGTFRKTGQTIRVYWTYGVRGEWIAPQIARIELAGTAAVYKLYTIIDQTAVSAPQSSGICREFLAVMLPAFDRAVAARLDTKPADATAESTAIGSVLRSADAGVSRGSGATAAGGGG
jgi:hypothetical protein